MSIRRFFLNFLILNWKSTEKCKGVANETVEKSNFEIKERDRFDQSLATSRRQRWSGVNRLKLGLDQRPEDVDFADYCEPERTAYAAIVHPLCAWCVG
jgi:hypothetical protein